MSRAALGCAIASVVLQPAALLIAARGDNGDATSGGVVLELIACVLLALTALALGIASLVRLRRQPGRSRGPAIAAIVIGPVSIVSAVVVGGVALVIASHGAWVHL